MILDFGWKKRDETCSVLANEAQYSQKIWNRVVRKWKDDLNSAKFANVPSLERCERM